MPAASLMRLHVITMDKNGGEQEQAPLQGHGAAAGKPKAAAVCTERTGNRRSRNVIEFARGDPPRVT